MRRGNLQTGGLILNGPQVITIGKRVASGRANNLVLEITADVTELRLGVVRLLGFQCPGLDRAIDLAQVIDAGIHLGRGTGFDEVRYRDRCQQPDNRHDDHDFHQGEASCLIFGSFHFEPFRPRGVNKATGGLLLITKSVHELPVADR
jgi:hypothetical protein